MNKQTIVVFQFLTLLGLSALIHYIFFVLIGLYQKDNTFSDIFIEYQAYIYILETSLLMGLFYGQLYRERKSVIWKVLAIIHGNIICYYYLVSALEFSETVSGMLIVGSLFGWFIVYSPIKQKFWPLVIDIVIISVAIVIESIPVYNKTVSLEILLSQEDTILYATNEAADSDSSTITIETDQTKRNYTVRSLWEEPLHLRGSIKNITYNSRNATGNIVILKTWNGLFVVISPQTQFSIEEEKNKTTPLLSNTSFETTAGNISIYPLNNLIQYTQHTGNIVHTKNDSSEQVISYINTYLLSIGEKSRQLFGWQYTDSKILENIILYKMLLYQFFDYQTYTPMVENFYNYRYLIYGDIPPFTSDLVFFPIQKIENTRTNPRAEVDPIDQINKGIEKSRSGTRLLGDWLGK